jgi:hypothetical protein
MEFAPFFLIIPLVIAVVIAIRIGAGSLDHHRLRSYVEERGGEVIEINWAPFGPGWFGGNKERIYHDRYLDRDGNEHEAYAKTNMWSGVYFTEDRITRYSEPPVDKEEVESLEEENARLRAELERLKRKDRDRNSDAIQE